MYRIRDWNEHFENNRSRAVEALTWVAIPNKQDGDGYAQLLNHEQGEAHYGAWCAIVLVASKCRPRGVLLRDGRTAHDAASIARKARMKEPIIADAIRRLLEIGWIEEVSDLTAAEWQATAAESQLPALHGREEKGREGKRKQRAAAPPVAVEIPTNLDHPPFPAAWSDWLAYRRDRRLSSRPQTLAAQLESLAPLGPAAAADCLRLSIRQGWQGVFPERQQPAKAAAVNPLTLKARRPV